MGHTCFSVPCPGVFPWTHTSCSHHANISSSSCLLVTTHLFPWGVYVGLEFPGPLVLGLCSALADSVQHLPRTDPFYVGELFIALTMRRCQAPACCCLFFSSAVCFQFVVSRFARKRNVNHWAILLGFLGLCLYFICTSLVFTVFILSNASYSQAIFIYNFQKINGVLLDLLKT